MRLSMSFVCLFVVASFFASFSAQAQTADADFQKALAEYQKMDAAHWQAATAEKVVKLAVAMEKLPPIPEEARKHFVMGQTMFKDAKSGSDFSMACQEFYQALHLAPWWPEAWYNMGLVHEAQGNYVWSMVSFKLYLLFKIPEAEARAVQDKIYALEAKQAMAANDKALADQKAADEKVAADKSAQEAAARAKESSPEAVAARKQNEYDAWLRSLDGARFISSPWASGSMNHNGELEYGLYYIVGKEVLYGVIDSWNSNGGNFKTAPIFRQNHWTRAAIQGKQFLGSTGSVGTISDDGQTITDRAPGQELGQVYTRVR